MTISVKKINGKFDLWTESLCGPNPAGWRLKKGGDFPIAGFSFNTEREAEAACRALQRYLDGYGKKEQLSAKERKLQEQRDRIDEMRALS